MATTTHDIGHRGARSQWLHFGRHFVEMVIAMWIGMLVGGGAVSFLFGRYDLLQRPDVSALVMATNMTIGMSLWMLYRKHSWPSIAEMGAAMYLPFIVLLLPYWLGQVPGNTIMMGGHALMLPAMLAAMLRRRNEYTRHHAHLATVSGQPSQVGSLFSA
jgi:hypothetical protein